MGKTCERYLYVWTKGFIIILFLKFNILINLFDLVSKCNILDTLISNGSSDITSKPIWVNELNLKKNK